jgi:hypothetical protein
MGPIGPMIPPEKLQKHPIYVNYNPEATPMESRVGEYLQNIAGTELLPGVKKAWGMPESHQQGRRSGDYRMILDDSTTIAADLYECTSKRIDNITSYISSKFDQADTIVIVTQHPLEFMKQICKALQEGFPAKVRPRRLFFLTSVGEDFIPMHDHIFSDKQVQKALW